MTTPARIKVEGIEEVRDTLARLPLQTARAVKRAVAIAAEYAKGRIAREMADRTGIPLRAFRDYRVASRGLGGPSRLVWGGYNPIKATYVAARGELEKQLPPNNFDWGAKAGKYLFEGAVALRMKSGHVGIFKREGRGTASHLVEQTVTIPEMQTVAEIIRDEATSRLATAFAHELRYELSQGS